MRENPIPVAIWIALAAGAAVLTGVVVYATTRPASTALTGPAIIPTQPPSTLSNSANAAFVEAGAQAAAKASEAAAEAVTQTALLNTTYALTVSSPQTSIALKVGDTIRLIPSMLGMPPVDRVWKWGSFDTSVLGLLGTTNGSDIVLKANAPGSVILNVQNVDVATGQTQFATYNVAVTVTS